MSECRFCQATVSNGLALCDACQQTLRVCLVNVAAFIQDVMRIKPGERVKVRSAYHSQPPPAIAPPRDKVSDEVDHVSSIVWGWCQNLADDRPQAGAFPLDTERRCGWLESHVSSIATLDWAAEIIGEMLDCEHRLQRLLDRSDTGWYAGLCGNEIGREWVGNDVEVVACPRQLYGVQGSAWVKCPECGRTWDSSERRVKMMNEARLESAPVTVIARVVVGLVDGEVSEQRLTRRIEKWIERDQLRDLGVRVIAGRPRRVYNLGEVFDLVQKERKPRENVA